MSLSCALHLIKLNHFTNDFEHLLFPPAPEAIDLKSILNLLFTEDYIGSADEDDDMTEEREQMFDANTSSGVDDLIGLTLYQILERHLFDLEHKIKTAWEEMMDSDYEDVRGHCFSLKRLHMRQPLLEISYSLTQNSLNQRQQFLVRRLYPLRRLKIR